jgi:germacradienol/geosmin synthase
MAGILHWHRTVDRYKAEHLAARTHGFLPDRPPALPLVG